MITQEQKTRLEELRGALEDHMASMKPRRYEHSLGVADTAGMLARVYGVDEFLAYAAGLLHDWDKVVPDAELLARAAQLGVRLAGSPVNALPLLHGPVAAKELPSRFDDLPDQVWQAIARHTVGAADMSPLDMVVFVADAIEPGRRGDYAVRLREMVGESSLSELFFQTFTQGLIYVMRTGRYLYPSALTVYNAYALASRE